MFSIYAIIWGRVEYRVKQAMPWKAMAVGTAMPSKSVLLDYISSLNIPAFPRAIINRHFPVAMSIFASLLIKLLIVASTALLTMEGITISPDSSIRPLLLTSDTFNGTGFDPSTVSGLPAVRALAVLATGKEYPGVYNTNPAAFQSFQMNSTNSSTITLGMILDYGLSYSV